MIRNVILENKVLHMYVEPNMVANFIYIPFSSITLPLLNQPTLLC
jgi:hypothetical protein